MGQTRSTGVVLSGTGGVWQVRLPAGETVNAALRGRVKNASDLKLAVGDHVDAERTGDQWVIAAIQPRRSQLARREPGSRYGERVLAANVDQVLIVFAAARPEPHLRMLDRFLVIAEANELQPRVVVNKLDLVDPAAASHAFAEYRHAGYAVHFTSVKTGAGIDELRKAMHGQVTVFTGPSGVGKSSLLNVMYPGLELRVGEISASVQKGRHTTVGASLHPLPGDEAGFVVDTPGLREVGLWNIPPADLAGCFPELRTFLGQCRFGDCTHTGEPDCAVRAAVDSGEISPARYDSYGRLRAELEEAESVLAPHGRRALRER